MEVWIAKIGRVACIGWRSLDYYAEVICALFGFKVVQHLRCVLFPNTSDGRGLALGSSHAKKIYDDATKRFDLKWEV